MAERNRPALRDEAAIGNYRRISTRMWNDRRVQKLGQPPPHPMTLFLFLLTHPDSKRMPALLRAREAALADQLNWKLKDFRTCFAQLHAEGMAEADWEAGLIWFPNAVKHDPPGAPNVLKSWAKIMRNEMPECALLSRAVFRLREDLKALFKAPEWPGEYFAEAFPEAFLQGLAKAFAEATTDARSSTSTVTGSVSEIRDPDPHPPPALSRNAPLRPPEQDGRYYVGDDEGFWACIQTRRTNRGLAVQPRPLALKVWFTKITEEIGESAGSMLVDAHEKYLDDDSFRVPNWPFELFMTNGIFRVRLGDQPPRRAVRR